MLLVGGGVFIPLGMHNYDWIIERWTDSLIFGKVCTSISPLNVHCLNKTLICQLAFMYHNDWIIEWFRDIQEKYAHQFHDFMCTARKNTDMQLFSYISKMPGMIITMTNRSWSKYISSGSDVSQDDKTVQTNIDILNTAKYFRKFHERKRFTCHKNYVNKQKGLQKKKFQKSTETEAIRCRIQWLSQCSCVHFFKSVDSWAIFNLYNTLHLHCFNNNLSFFINQAMTQKKFDSSVTFKNRYTHGTSFQITEWLNTKTFIPYV